MTTIVRETIEVYDLLINQYSDPRVEKWLLMSSPVPMILLLIFYQYFVRSLGPWLMKDREPFKLDKVMIIYNLAQILVNGWFVEEVASFTWMFFMTKVFDLLDTVFMVLRKRSDQVSFLHLYHHTGMVLATWIGTKYVAGGHGILFGTINSFVHAVMYIYYLLTALNPEYKKSIWWKKHITELQLIQFVLTTLHSAIALFNPYCRFPKVLLAAFIPQDVFMFILFLDFYRKAYLDPKKKIKE